MGGTGDKDAASRPHGRVQQVGTLRVEGARRHEVAEPAEGRKELADVHRPVTPRDEPSRVAVNATVHVCKRRLFVLFGAELL